MNFRTPRPIAFLAVLSLTLSACQPTPEERLDRARAFIDAAEYQSAVLELKNTVKQDPENAEARLMLAQSSYQLGDYGTAMTEYERAINLGIETPEVWIALGRTLLATNRSTEIVARILPNLESAQDQANVSLFEGDVMRSLENWRNAEAAYDRALRSDPSSVEAMVGLGLVKSKTGDNEIAGQLLDRALDADPSSAFVWRGKGHYFQMLRANDDAAEAYLESISVESPTTTLGDRFTTRINRASVLVEAGRSDEAEAQLNAAREIFTDYPVLHFLQGRIFFARGDFENAQRELQIYLSNAPNDPRGQALLGATNFSQSNLRQAEMYLLQAVRAQFGGEGVQRMLAETQLRLDKPELALEGLRQIEEEGRTDSALMAMLGRAQFGVGDAEAAARYFEQSVAENPGSQSVILALAVTYLRLGRVQDAINVLEAVPAEQDNLYRREALLLGAYLRNSQRDQALALGSDLLKQHPSDPTVLTMVGVLHNSMGRVAEAQRLFDQALELDPVHAGALYSQGNIAAAAGDFDSAARSFGMLLDAQPAFVPGLVALADVLKQEGKGEQLRARLDAAINAQPNQLALWVLLVNYQIEEGDYEAALEAIASASEFAPDNPGLQFLEGSVRTRQGMLSQAVRSMQAAVNAAPNNAVYVFGLARANLLNGDYGAAARGARKYIDIRPADLRGIRLLVDAEIRAGEPNRAEASLANFAARNPELRELEILRGDVMLANGSAAAAVSQYELAASENFSRTIAMKLARARFEAGLESATEPLERWLGVNPEDTEVRFLCAQFHQAQGRSDQAVDHYEVLLESDSLTAIGLNNLAWEYSLQGRAKAIELAKRAHELAPDNGDITDTYGWILHKQGQSEIAIEMLELAVRQQPDNGEIRYHLAEVLALSGRETEAKSLLVELLQSDQDFPSKQEADRLANSL